MASASDTHDTVLVVDFGAQYAQLIARRVREARVHSEIVPADITAAEVRERNPRAVIFSGGPASVNVEGAPSVESGIYDLGIPLLGICYGHQLIARDLGGSVSRSGVGEYGRTELEVVSPSGLLADVPASMDVWMSHADAVEVAPPGFEVTATTTSARPLRIMSMA